MKMKRIDIAETPAITKGKTIHMIVVVLFAITVSCILLSICFFSFWKYQNKKDWIPNIIVIAVVTPILFLAARSSVKFGKWYRTRTWKLLFVLALFIVQIQSVYCYFFYTGWDVKKIISASLLLAHGEKISKSILKYYSYYPNNLFMTSMFSGMIRFLNTAFPQTKGTEAEYVILLIVQCLISQLAGMLVYCAAKRLFCKERYACISYCFFVFLQGCSPWVSIPYSDSMGLVIPVAILILYLIPVNGKKTILKWFGIAALSWLGFKIKPQNAVISIAIIIIELFSLRQTITAKKQELLKAAVGIGIGLVCAVGIVAGCLHLFCNIQIDTEKRLGAAHFFMMGMNSENGTWASEDVEYSRSFQTKNERDSADLQLATERINQMFPEELIRHFIKKTLINYNDGTFAWENEGNFYTEIREKPDDSFSLFLRNIYYKDGKYQTLWMQFVHAIWVSVLFLSFFAFFSQRNKYMSVMMLTVIGLTVFLTIFEARARYIFSNIPIFILLAVSGLRYITDRVKVKRI